MRDGAFRRWRCKNGALEHSAAVGSVFWLGALVALGRIDAKAPEYWTDSPAEDVTGFARCCPVWSSATTTSAAGLGVYGRRRVHFQAQPRARKDRRAYDHRRAPPLPPNHRRFLVPKRRRAQPRRILGGAGTASRARWFVTRAAVTYVEAGNVAREHFAAKKAHEYYQKGLSLLGSDDARLPHRRAPQPGRRLALARANRRSIGRISRDAGAGVSPGTTWQGRSRTQPHGARASRHGLARARARAPRNIAHAVRARRRYARHRVVSRRHRQIAVDARRIRDGARRAAAWARYAQGAGRRPLHRAEPHKHWA